MEICQKKIKILLKTLKLSGTFFKDLSAFYCCQQHYMLIQVLSSVEMVSGC
jgi:DUF1365 family protein